MNDLQVFDRVTELLDSGFADWRLGLTPAEERRLVDEQVDGVPTWPFNAAACAELSGGLPDLPSDADDDAILELIRHGLTLIFAKIVPFDDLCRERERIEQEVLAWGRGVDSRLEQHAKNN